MSSTGNIEVLKPGLFSSIQDLGRTGFLSYGVPIGGAMDRYAHKLANLYLQNDQDAATLEITLVGPKLQFDREAQIVITGADFSPQLNGEPVSQSVVIQVKPGDNLSFGSAKSGVRAYLGIKHGFLTPVKLGARGWTEGVTSCFRLAEGMKLPYTPLKLPTNFPEVRDLNAIVAEQEFHNDGSIRVLAGPEFDLLSENQQVDILKSFFKIGAATSRMGIQLEGKVENTLESIITGPVLPGTVQLTPSGRLIVLMRDCQTTGGYPRVLQLTARGIDQMAQKAVGEKVYWELERIDGII